MDSEAINWAIRYGYIIMFLVMLVEGPVVTASGALAAALGYFNVYVVFALSFAANFGPDVLYYGVGHRAGNQTLDRFGERLGISRTRRDRAVRFIGANMGAWLVFIKTVPLISPPGLAVMGALRIPFRQFLWRDVLIVALTSLFFVMVGYYSGKGYDSLRNATEYGGFWLAGLFILFIAMSYVTRRLAGKFAERIRDFQSEQAAIGQVKRSDSRSSTG